MSGERENAPPAEAVAAASAFQIRQRDLFPLPFLSEPPRSRLHGTGSSRCVRRVRQSQTRAHWANEGILALNQLAGRGNSCSKNLPIPKASQDVVDDLVKCYDALSPGDDRDGSDEVALRELLKNASIYSDVRADVAPYSKDLVSWPGDGASPISLVDALPPADSAKLCDWACHMLRDPADAESVLRASGITKPHCDRVLFRSPRIYGDFLKELDRRGMIGWRLAEGASGLLGVFLVQKKSGHIRIIFDTRVLNTKFKDPPSTSLPSAAAFSNIEVPQGGVLQLGSADITNAFYGMSVLEDLSRLFTLPSIRAKYLDASAFGGRAFAPDDVLLPCLRVLPMGWSWSLHLCQCLVASVVGKFIVHGNMIADKSPPVVLDAPSAVCGAAYVDNFAVAGCNPSEVTRTLDAICHHFQSLGLQVHEVCYPSCSAEFVGLSLRDNWFSIKPSRIWRLRRGIRQLLLRGVCSGSALEVPHVGHVGAARVPVHPACSISAHTRSLLAACPPLRSCAPGAVASRRAVAIAPRAREPALGGGGLL